MSVVDEIAAERKRQIEQEGWSLEHDDSHDGGQMALAAACYAANSIHADAPYFRNQVLPAMWRWGWGWWKPKDARRDLVRAGALIVAEIERLDRLNERMRYALDAATPPTERT